MAEDREGRVLGFLKTTSLIKNIRDACSTRLKIKLGSPKLQKNYYLTKYFAMLGEEKNLIQ
jgi:hypothetical protein